MCSPLCLLNFNIFPTEQRVGQSWDKEHAVTQGLAKTAILSSDTISFKSVKIPIDFQETTSILKVTGGIQLPLFLN